MIFFLILLIAACKTDEELIQTWKGKKRVDLVANMGKPTGIVPDGQGGEVYEYATALHTPNTGGQNDVFYRVKCFYVNANGVIYNCISQDSRTQVIEMQ